MRMDAIDRMILATLETEGRLTVADLAKRVGLTAAPCLRRVRELERSGVIRGYRADVDPAALGLGFEVLLSVTMDREDAGTIDRFEAELVDVPEVRQAERLFGDPDYLLRVVTADIAAYQRLRDEVLGRLPGVARMTSTIVMKQVVGARPVATIPARRGR
jgi:DNA-binding Lrp family transcriptional regulator